MAPFAPQKATLFEHSGLPNQLNQRDRYVRALFGDCGGLDRERCGEGTGVGTNLKLQLNRVLVLTGHDRLTYDVGGVGGK